MKKQLVLFLTLICLIVPVFSFAEGFPSPSTDFYVYDEVGILEKDTVDYIININTQLEEQTGAQAVVAVVDSLQGKDIEEYSLEIFRKWGIGDKDKNNGVLLLVSPNDKKVRIEVGYGLEGAITDSDAGRILDTFVLLKFKEDSFDKGVKDGFSALIGFIKDEYDIELEELDDVMGDLILELIILAVIVIIVVAGVVLIDENNSGFTSRSSGFGGGSSGFGGGGSSGGGGASGGW